MAETMGEIKHESKPAEWKAYVQRYPGTCLMAGGALGWLLGRRLHSFRQSPLSSQPELPLQPESSTFSRTADKQLMERKGRGWPSPIILTLCSQMS